MHCLDAGGFVKGEVRVIGTTLWTDYQADISVPQDLAMFYINNSLSDHKVIKYKSGGSYGRFKPQHALATHRQEFNWLSQQLKGDFDGKTVVVTHHGPHPVCQHPAFPVSEMSGAFHSDLSDLIESNDIDVWAFGHTHANLDSTVNGMGTSRIRRVILVKMWLVSMRDLLLSFNVGETAKANLSKGMRQFRN